MKHIERIHKTKQAVIWIKKASNGSLNWVDEHCPKAQFEWYLLFKRTKNTDMCAKIALVLLTLFELPSSCKGTEYECAHANASVYSWNLPTISTRLRMLIAACLYLFIGFRLVVRQKSLGENFSLDAWYNFSWQEYFDLKAEQALNEASNLKDAALKDKLERKWREVEQRLWYLFQGVVCSLGLICCVITCFYAKQGTIFWLITIMCRPLLLVGGMKKLRNAFTDIAYSVQGYAVVLAALFLTIWVFIWMGMVLFCRTPEGKVSFFSWGDAVAVMWILFTTSNDPNAWIPAYSTSRYSVLFFVIFLLITIYLLLSLLLAKIYGTYQDILRERVEDESRVQKEAMEKSFDTLATESAEHDHKVITHETWVAFFKECCDPYIGIVSCGDTSPEAMDYNVKRGVASLVKHLGQNFADFYQDEDRTSIMTKRLFKHAVGVLIDECLFIPSKKEPSLKTSTTPVEKMTKSSISSGRSREEAKPKFSAGDRVKVSCNMQSDSKDRVDLPEGTMGYVIEVDKKSDIFIRFDGFDKGEWIFSNHSSNLEVPWSDTPRKFFQDGADMVVAGKKYHIVWDTVVDWFIGLAMPITLWASVSFARPKEIKPVDFRQYLSFQLLLVLSCLYTVGITVKIWSLGFERFWNRKKVQHRFDFFNVYLLMIAELTFFIFWPLGTLARVIIIFHLLRGFRLLALLPPLQSLFKIVVTLIPKFWQMFLVMFVVYYMFAVLGQYLFGGLIYTTNPILAGTNFASAGFWPLNFNDLPSGFVTLFALMIVNNWYEIAQGFMFATYSKFAALYFVIFFVVVNLIVLNIIMALIIDCNLAVEDDDNDKDRAKSKDDVVDPEDLESGAYLEGASQRKILRKAVLDREDSGLDSDTDDDPDALNSNRSIAHLQSRRLTDDGIDQEYSPKSSRSKSYGTFGRRESVHSHGYRRDSLDVLHTSSTRNFEDFED